MSQELLVRRTACNLLLWQACHMSIAVAFNTVYIQCQRSTCRCAGSHHPQPFASVQSDFDELINTQDLDRALQYVFSGCYTQYSEPAVCRVELKQMSETSPMLGTLKALFVTRQDDVRDVPSACRYDTTLQIQATRLQQHVSEAINVAYSQPMQPGKA